MKTDFKEQDLPYKDLEKLGLYVKGRMLLSQENIDALLAGRRTEMNSFRDLKLEGLNIRKLDAKLSLIKNEDGSIGLNIHPIYKKVKPHHLLNENESELLQKGEVDNIVKEERKKDTIRKLIIEYDEQTKEFISYDPDQVRAPIKVNGEELDENQKKKFRHGEIVELSDGIKFQHTALNSQGIRSDSKRLALSVLLDAGISYLVYRGVQALRNRAAKYQNEGYSSGYNQALADMKGKEKKLDANMTVEQLIENHKRPKQETRGYGRTSSR